MKKKVLMIAVVVAVAVCAVALTACANVTGTYVCEMGETGMKMTLELKDGNKFVMTTAMSLGDVHSDDVKQEGTYKVDGDKLTLIMEVGDVKSEQECTIMDGVISMKQDGVTIEFKKK